MEYHEGQSSTIGRKVSQLVNSARRDHGVGALEDHPELESVAGSYARRLCLGREYGHYVDGTPQDRASDFAGVNENLYRTTIYGYDPDRVSQSAVDGWENSKEHRETMFREDAKLGGVGVAVGGDTVYICHLVASRKRILARAKDRIQSAVPL